MDDAIERSNDEIDIEGLRRRYAAERAARLRPDGSAQYQKLAGKFSQFDRDPNADPDFKRLPSSRKSMSTSSAVASAGC